jgi:hypothetical protein
MIPRMLKKAGLLTRPTLARRDAPCPKQGRRRSKNRRRTLGAHGATNNKEHQVCARRRVIGSLRFPQDAQNGIPARPQGARRLKRTPFPPAHPELPRQLNHRGGTLQGDGRLRTTLEEKRVLARRGGRVRRASFSASCLVHHNLHQRRPQWRSCAPWRFAKRRKGCAGMRR